MAAPPKGRGDKSTGFVVKLYQMVNGAPDDIVSVREAHQIMFAPFQ